VNTRKAALPGRRIAEHVMHGKRLRNHSEKTTIKKCSVGEENIISSLLPASLPLPSLLPASLPLPSLLLPCGFHLLPERVIFSLNLAINKYFGRDAHLRHRIIPNHTFFP
jgi:hypothetical protein